MTLTPNNLKHFRAHFCLTQQQAADLLHKTKRQWWRWEQEYDPIPANLGLALQKQFAFLVKAIAFREKWCQNPRCTKNVEKAKKRGLPSCPYCGRSLAVTRKKLIASVLPKVCK